MQQNALWVVLGTMSKVKRQSSKTYLDISIQIETMMKTRTVCKCKTTKTSPSFFSTGTQCWRWRQHWISSAECLSALENQCWRALSTRNAGFSTGKRVLTNIQHWISSADEHSALENECWRTFSTGNRVLRDRETLRYTVIWNKVAYCYNDSYPLNTSYTYTYIYISLTHVQQIKYTT